MILRVHRHNFFVDLDIAQTACVLKDMFQINIKGLFTDLQKDIRGHPFKHTSWKERGEHGAFQTLSTVSSF